MLGSGTKSDIKAATGVVLAGACTSAADVQANVEWSCAANQVEDDMHRAISAYFQHLFCMQAARRARATAVFCLLAAPRGAQFEAQASMEHYDDMAEPWALMESTPGCPRPGVHFR